MVAGMSAFSDIRSRIVFGSEQNVLDLFNFKEIAEWLIYFPVFLWGVIMCMTETLPMGRTTERLDSIVCLQECILLTILLHACREEIPKVSLFAASAYKFTLSCMHEQFVIKGPCRELHFFASVAVLMLLPQEWYKRVAGKQRPSVAVAAATSFVVLQSGLLQITDGRMVGFGHQLILVFDLFVAVKFFLDCLNRSCNWFVLLAFTTYQILNSYVWMHFLDMIPDVTRLHSVSALQDQEGFMEDLASYTAVLIFLFALSSVIASTMNLVVGKVK